MISSAASGSRLATGSSASNTRGRGQARERSRPAAPDRRKGCQRVARQIGETDIARWPRAGSSSDRQSRRVQSARWNNGPARRSRRGNTLVWRIKLTCCHSMASSRRARRSFRLPSAQRSGSLSHTSPAVGFKVRVMYRSSGDCRCHCRQERRPARRLTVSVKRAAQACRWDSAATDRDTQHRSVPPKASGQLREIDVQRLHQIADDVRADRFAARAE